MTSIISSSSNHCGTGVIAGTAGDNEQQTEQLCNRNMFILLPSVNRAQCECIVWGILQSRPSSEHALNSWPPSWIGEPRKPGMSTIEWPRVWEWGELGKGGGGGGGKIHVFSSSPHSLLLFRSSQSSQFARTKMAAETIGWIYPLPNKMPAVQAMFGASKCPEWCHCQSHLSLGQRVLPTPANSSQVTKSKLASVGGQTIPPSRASLQETHLIVWIRLCSHITITKQLGLSWAKIWVWSNSSQLNPTRAKWVAKRYPTPSKLWTWLELAWVGRAVWPGPKLPYLTDWNRAYIWWVRS